MTRPPDRLDIPTLETERLRLRSFRRSDIDDYAALNADPEVMRYLGGGGEVWDRGRSWRHLGFLLGHWLLGGSGMWAVEEKGTGRFLGMVGFADPEGWPGFELAWTLARPSWGCGYATEGARAALAYAFTTLDRSHVISLIHPDNLASIRVAQRLGESLRGRTELRGEERLVYGIDRESDAAQEAVLPVRALGRRQPEGSGGPPGGQLRPLRGRRRPLEGCGLPLEGSHRPFTGQ